MRRGLRERKPPRASASKKGAQDRQGETAVASMTHETNASDDVTTPPIGKQDLVAHARQMGLNNSRAVAISKLKGAAKKSAMANFHRKAVAMNLAAAAEMRRLVTNLPIPGGRDEELSSIESLPPRSLPELGVCVAVIRDATLEAGVMQLRDSSCARLQEGQSILNDAKDSRRKAAKDLSRRMHEWPPECSLHALLGNYALRVATYLGCRVAATSPLSSLPPPPGGRRQHQVAHHDYSQKKLQKWLEGGNITYAWTLLFAVSDNARLFVVAADGARVVLVFQPGEAVLFRGDVLHGGMAYSYRHWRAHFYLEPIGAPSLRHEDDGRKTFLALHSLEPPEKQREGMHARAVYSAESLNSAVVRCIAASVCG